MPNSKKMATRAKIVAGKEPSPSKLPTETLTGASRGPASTASGPLPPVRVRMYRQGLGDCFLITFQAKPNERHMLIDCGTLGSSQDVQMQKVIEDIHSTTDGHIHLLIVTHEHKDHVSGFGSYDDVFKTFKIDRVWMAWTEDASDPLAQELAKNKEDLAFAALQASHALRASSESDAQELGEAVQDLLEFAGLAATGGLATTIDQAMDFVRGLAPARFLRPGGPMIEEDWLPGFRFYVLGPPHLRKDLEDTGEHGSSELYGMAATLAASFPGPMTPRDSSSDPNLEAEMPFDTRFRVTESDPVMIDSLESYHLPSEQWRKVDSNWLNAAATLALQLDSLTNNTSLALAIERVADGKVLLFPGDAQQGNWLSWHAPEMRWESKAPGVPPLTVTDLLRRTVFYKVGHHGSHNATAKGQGLELMTNQTELTAFIPVDRQIALRKSPKGSWRMPARELYRHLLEQCQGRVVRADTFWADDATNATNKETEEEFLMLADAKTWTEWKKQQALAEKNGIVKIDQSSPPLYIDYLLK